MSQPDDTTPNLFDPLGFWRTTQNASLDAWSKAMIQLVNTDAYAQATGRMLDTYIGASLPMRKIVEQTMTQVLGQINMPTRAEVLSIAERMTNIEMRLDDLDARFDDLLHAMTQIAANTANTAPAQPNAIAAKSESTSASTALPTTSKSRPRRTRAAASGRSNASTRAKE